MKNMQIKSLLVTVGLLFLTNSFALYSLHIENNTHKTFYVVPCVLGDKPLFCFGSAKKIEPLTQARVDWQDGNPTAQVESNYHYHADVYMDNALLTPWMSLQFSVRRDSAGPSIVNLQVVDKQAQRDAMSLHISQDHTQQTACLNLIIQESGILTRSPSSCFKGAPEDAASRKLAQDQDAEFWHKKSEQNTQNFVKNTNPIILFFSRIIAEAWLKLVGFDR
jgi:hypothetical protein